MFHDAMLVKWFWYKRYHPRNTPPTVQIRTDTTLSTIFRIPLIHHIARFLHTFAKEHTIISDMAANAPRDVDAMVDCTVPIIITILTCWFMEWLRRGRQAQVDKERHNEQMALLRKIETGSFTFAPRIEKPATPQSNGVSLNRSEERAISQSNGVPPSRSQNPATSQPDDVSLSQNDKLSKLRVDFIGMLEDCAKLQDAHHSDLSQLEVDVQIANEEKQNLAKELQKAQASLKLSEKEAFDAKAKQIHVANEAAAQLNALQSKYDTVVVDLRAAEGNARRVTFAQQPNGSHDNSTAELRELQAKYDAVVQDLQTARDEVDRIALEAQSNHDHDDLVTELGIMQAKYKQVLYDLAVSEVKAQEAEKTREVEKAQEAEKAREAEKSTASNESEDDTAEKLENLQAGYLKAVQDREDAELKANEEQGKRVFIEIKYNDTIEMLEELKPCLEKKEEDYEQLKKEKTELERRVLNLEKGVYSDIEAADPAREA
jgi:ribosomal protein S8